VFKTFADVLRPRGYLVLGRVEMLSRDVQPRFEVVDLRERVYRKL
jgi:chemotaxis methyl-accepting protein methylase